MDYRALKRTLILKGLPYETFNKDCHYIAGGILSVKENGRLAPRIGAVRSLVEYYTEHGVGEEMWAKVEKIQGIVWARMQRFLMRRAYPQMDRHYQIKGKS